MLTWTSHARAVDVVGDALEGGGAVGVDAPLVVLGGRTVEGDLQRGDALSREEVLVGVEVGPVGDRPEAGGARLARPAHDVLDRGATGGE